jgi:Domain of unknown function (DUF4337)
MEEIEVPTEHLHETIGEKAEEAKEGTERRSSMYIAISTALMAVFAAMASLMAGHHSDEAVIEQIRASDHWAYYQAKGIKAEIQSLTNNPGKDAAIEKYKKDQEDIKKDAEEEEKASHDHLEHHAVLAKSVTLFQIAIAISAIAILTRKKPLWFGAIAVSLIGFFFFVYGIIV